MLAESPRNANLLYVGTDDGNLWVTKDGGQNWSNITSSVGLPGPRWVNSIEPSRSKEGRVYVVFDGHRNNDDAPHVYVSEDYGQSWKSLNANLPKVGTTRVLREDPSNTNLLYLGTEFALYASINRGQSWTKINNNLPTVAIHEIAIHDKMQEIVAGTHGRSLWVLDVSALRQMKPSLVDEKVHLFKPNRAVQWRSEPFRGTIYGMGQSAFSGSRSTTRRSDLCGTEKECEKCQVENCRYRWQDSTGNQCAEECGSASRDMEYDTISTSHSATGSASTFILCESVSGCLSCDIECRWSRVLRRIWKSCQIPRILHL